jgi:hypothetical protein
MAQHDYVIANGTGAAVRSDLNNALAAIVSQNSGATEPATMYAYQWWADTTTGLLKLRNAANNAWITLRELDGTLTIEAGTVSAPGLAFASDLNTGIYSPSADQLAIATNGVERVEFGTSEVVFNDGGTNYDFRIEGDTNANLFFVDASADAVGLGTSSPGYRLTVVDNSSGVQGRFESSSTSGTTLGFVNTATNGRNYRIGSNYVTGNGEFAIYDDTAAASRLFINSSGSVGIGTTSPQELFHVNTGASGGQVLRMSTNGTDIGYLYQNTGGVILGAYSTRFLGFETNGSERARIDSSGRLLVGTSTNQGSANLQIKGSDSSCGIFLQRDVDASALTSAGNYLAWLRFGNQQGFVGAEILAETDAAWNSGGDTTDNPGRLVFSTTADGASSPTERARITQQGYLKATSSGDYYGSTATYHESRTNAVGNVTHLFSHAGTSGNSYGIQISYAQNRGTQAGDQYIYCNDSAALRMEVRGNGGIANYSANNVNLSDRNAKKDIVLAAGTWDCLKEWEIVNFRYKDQPDDADLNMGVIAQQVAESCPEVITVFQEAKEATETKPAQEERLGVKDQQMMWMAIKALQEAQIRIETLEAEVAALKAS